ncbi:nucleoside phosphorylase domain-containing protein [Phyllosticta citribraziliensis]
MSNPNKYTVGWICAIQTEYIAAQQFLDEKHEGPEYVSAHDKNDYTLGRMGKHNVVIAVLPNGEYGLTSAATVATDLLHTFANVRIGLMVGIAGGAPSMKHDIRLGDVVVSSQSDGQGGGVFQYDFGKTVQNEAFQNTRYLNQPPNLLRAAITGLSADHAMDGHTFEEDIDAILERKERLRDKFSRPDLATDRLYKSEYTHRGPDSDALCSDVCGNDEENSVSRPGREMRKDDPVVHYGIIASANQLMKDATVRDKLARERNVLCFEMEAAGLMNHYPCMVIRGICDYSDSHKNKEWQGYAAMTAAAYAKALLCRIAPTIVEAQKTMQDAMAEISQDFESLKNGNNEIMSRVTDLDSRIQSTDIQKWLSPPDPSPNYHNAIAKRYEDTGSWFLDSPEYDEWKEQRGSFMWLRGAQSCGKTVLSSIIIQHLQTAFPTADESEERLSIPPITIFFFFKSKDPSKKTLEQMMRSLVLQLYKLSLASQAPLQQLFLSCHKGAVQPSVDMLCDTFWEMVHAVDDEVFIVLDGLDRCRTAQAGSHVKGGLTWLKDFAVSSPPGAHILATSRGDETDIVEAFNIIRFFRPVVLVTLEEEEYSIKKDFLSFCEGFVLERPDLSEGRKAAVADITEQIDYNFGTNVRMLKASAFNYEGEFTPFIFSQLEKYRPVVDNLGYAKDFTKKLRNTWFS